METTGSINKVITTMLIGPLYDHIYCAQSAFTHVGLVHCITSQPANVKYAQLSFSSTLPTGWLKSERGTFQPRVWWASSPFGGQPMGSYLLPIDTYGLSLTGFELFNWLQKRFRSPIRPG